MAQKKKAVVTSKINKPKKKQMLAVGKVTLDALELFLANVPTNSSMAFVIIQHLDPAHKGIMVELLQRSVPMRVVRTSP